MGSPFPVKNRDYVFMGTTAFSANGNLFMVQRSLPHLDPSSPDHVPQHPSAPPENERLAVRGHMYLTGYRVCPVKSAPGRQPRIRLMQIVDVNPGGSIPNKLVIRAMDQ